MLYIVLYMSATRTQIYLTPELRARVDDVMRREHKSLAQIVRDALDAYLAAQRPDPDAALAATFGSMPDLSVPQREEWERG
jgi:metal-responsive CopG/Arc/MetJ family transcriptional regulator